MIKALKKVLACTLAAALVVSTATVASAATESPSSAVQPKNATNVKAAKANGVVNTVDTKKNGTAILKKIAKTTKKSVVVAGTVKVNGVSYAVTTINAKAFANCSNVTTVTLPASIKTINKNAFYGAKKLKTINFKGTKAITIKKDAFKGSGVRLSTWRMTFKVSKKMSKKEFNKLKKALKKAGFHGAVKRG